MTRTVRWFDRRRVSRERRWQALPTILLLGVFCYCCCCLGFFLHAQAFSAVPTTTTTTTTTPSNINIRSLDSRTTTTETECPRRRALTTILPETVWRKVAEDHRTAIEELLRPGLVGLDHELMLPVRKQYRISNNDNDGTGTTKPMTMLDPKHPIYNFLVEYYGLKGLKGPKRLARWSPSIGLFFWDRSDKNNNDNDDDDGGVCHTTTISTQEVRRIESLEDYYKASNSCFDSGTIAEDSVRSISGRDETDRGIFLEGATPSDFALTLYLQGAEWIDPSNSKDDDQLIYGGKQGILYRPIRFFDDASDENDNDNDSMIHEGKETPTQQGASTDNNDNNKQKKSDDTAQIAHRKATSFLWFKSVLQQTLTNEPVLHCYGLHEWAMQYHPQGALPPPSGKYQAHLPLRVTRETINSTVERRGIRCTHVDALRFFAPSAGPLNHHGATLEREDQLRLEQRGCVHAHMDLLKIALRIKPYCDPSLLVDVLAVALHARTLDVGASPYDCSSYSNSDDDDDSSSSSSSGTPIPVIPVETPEGRALYKKLQTELSNQAAPIRERLLANYQAFGALAFATDQLLDATSNPTDERFAKAEPGGRAWRQNLIDRKQTTGTSSSNSSRGQHKVVSGNA